jgi:hypothetical protein
MIVRITHARFLSETERLDAKYFLSEGVLASEKMALAKSRGLNVQTLGTTNGENGIADRIWRPLRFRRAYAAKGEPSVPYLRPYDALEYLPVAADHLSKGRTKRLETYRIKAGMILQTCSGRNLGPALMVDEYLARFVVGDDMIRIEISDEKRRMFVLAFLQSQTGQRLLKWGKTGSVIDHISEDHVSALEIPQLDSRAQKAASEAISEAVELRQKARLELDRMLSAYESTLPKIPSATQHWSISARHLSSRIDSAFYSPDVARIRAALLKSGGMKVESVATVIKPAGRYKTHYVEKEYGRPILSGAQMLQAHPINLRYISPRSFKDVTKYELSSKWITYQADGRAEEALGLPAMITSDRDGWLASGHVGRLIANEARDSGWLWLACRTEHVQKQIKAFASRSVVDSTFPFDMENVILPPSASVNSRAVESLWESFAKAQRLEDDATAIVETAIDRVATA